MERRSWGWLVVLSLLLVAAGSSRAWAEVSRCRSGLEALQGYLVWRWLVDGTLPEGPLENLAVTEVGISRRICFCSETGKAFSMVRQGTSVELSCPDNIFGVMRFTLPALRLADYPLVDRTAAVEKKGKPPSGDVALACEVVFDGVYYKTADGTDLSCSLPYGALDETSDTGGVGAALVLGRYMSFWDSFDAKVLVLLPRAFVAARYPAAAATSLVARGEAYRAENPGTSNPYVVQVAAVRATLPGADEALRRWASDPASPREDRVAAADAVADGAALAADLIRAGDPLAYHVFHRLAASERSTEARGLADAVAALALDTSKPVTFWLVDAVRGLRRLGDARADAVAERLLGTVPSALGEPVAPFTELAVEEAARGRSAAFIHVGVFFGSRDDRLAGWAIDEAVGRRWQRLRPALKALAERRDPLGSVTAARAATAVAELTRPTRAYVLGRAATSHESPEWACDEASAALEGYLGFLWFRDGAIPATLEGFVPPDPEVPRSIGVCPASGRPYLMRREGDWVALECSAHGMRGRSFVLPAARMTGRPLSIEKVLLKPNASLLRGQSRLYAGSYDMRLLGWTLGKSLFECTGIFFGRPRPYPVRLAGRTGLALALGELDVRRRPTFGTPALHKSRLRAEVVFALPRELLRSLGRPASP